MTETRSRDWFWLYIPWSALLWGIGGWCCKSVRRFALPATGAWMSYRYGLVWWRCLGYALSTALVFSLGYDPARHSWLAIILTLTSYGLTPLFLYQWSAWHLLMPVITGGVLSLIYTASLAWGLPHKVFELACGGLHGLWVSLAIHEDEQGG